MRHEGGVKARGRIREEAASCIAECPDASGRIADLTAKNAARAAATKELNHGCTLINTDKKHLAIRVHPRPSVVKSSQNCAILTDSRAEKGRFGGTPKWAGESPALPMRFSVFLSVLRLFSANRHKSLSMNNLQLIANFRNQGQLRLIKVN